MYTVSIVNYRILWGEITSTENIKKNALLDLLSQVGPQNISTAPVWTGKAHPPMSVQDITLNNLMVRFQ